MASGVSLAPYKPATAKKVPFMGTNWSLRRLPVSTASPRWPDIALSERLLPYQMWLKLVELGQGDAFYARARSLK
jgi:hypothetical protein